MSDNDRSFAQTCAHCIAHMNAIDDGEPSMVCVVIATQRDVLEIDSSTVMVGDTTNPPELLMEVARRMRPALETLLQEIARERGEPCIRRIDLEAQLMRRPAGKGDPS